MAEHAVWYREAMPDRVLDVCLLKSRRSRFSCVCGAELAI
jgi:hypothetical protein